MTDGYSAVKTLHMVTVTLTVIMLLLRFFWLQTGSAMMQRRWVRIVPHLNDTLLLLSGAWLVAITHFYPFTSQGAWLTEKLFGVIIYIVLGFIALGRKPRAQKVRWIAFIVATAMLVLIYHLATTKMPLLGNV